MEKKIDQTLKNPERELTRANNLRFGRIRLLRAEMEELDTLYQEGVLKQYTFMDLKGELRRKRDHVIAGIPHAPKSIKARRANLFLRLEDSLISSLREHDSTAGLLAHYQNLRLSHHLIKDVAHILMTKAALALLPELDFLTDDQRHEIQEAYTSRLALFKQNINEIRQIFPEFYKRFESRFSGRAALAGALAAVDEALQHGGIGVKAFSRIEQILETELEHIPPITAPVPELENSELIGMVPLLKGLPGDLLEEIARQAQAVTFLMDDTIIGQGDHGDALYIIVKGRVAVHRRVDNGEEEQIALLGAGDFFSETALLGDSVRTATVRAVTECTLLRITHTTIIGIAEHYPVVAERLKHELQERDIFDK